jgi:hypothetical protein
MAQLWGIACLNPELVCRYKFKIAGTEKSLTDGSKCIGCNRTLQSTMHTLSLVKLLTCCCSLGAAGRLIELKAPTNLPHGASQPVDHAFASFSWPVHFFAEYAGTRQCYYSDNYVRLHRSIRKQDSSKSLLARYHQSPTRENRSIPTHSSWWNFSVRWV